MLQVLLLLGLTLELIVYALLTLYWRRHGMDGILITLFVLMLAVGWRIAAVLPCYLVSCLLRLRVRHLAPLMSSVRGLAGANAGRALALALCQPVHHVVVRTAHPGL